MAPPAENDPRLTRFRRGAPGGETQHVGAPGPPPVLPEFAGQLEPAASDPALPPVAPTTPQPPAFAPPVAPPVDWAAPPAPDSSVPSREAPSSEHLFAEFESEKGAEPLYETPAYDWMPVEVDPGRSTGIASIAVGIFFGIIGLFIGVHSIRKSRAVGLAGGIGIAGVIVSSLSVLLFGSVVLSWVRYEVELAQQCSLVGPGQYYTSSGDLVTCS